MTDDFGKTAAQLEKAGIEFAKAAEHCREAAQHFRLREVPRGCAHGLAARGHLLQASELLDDVAKRHADKASVTGNRKLQ